MWSPCQGATAIHTGGTAAGLQSKQFRKTVQGTRELLKALISQCIYLREAWFPLKRIPFFLALKY